MSRGEQLSITNYEVSMTQGEEEEELGARVAGAGRLCPGIRSVKVTINMDTDSGVRHLAPLHHLEELILDCCSALGPGLDTLLTAGGGYNIELETNIRFATFTISERTSRTCCQL